MGDLEPINKTLGSKTLINFIFTLKLFEYKKYVNDEVDEQSVRFKLEVKKSDCPLSAGVLIGRILDALEGILLIT